MKASVAVSASDMPGNKLSSNATTAIASPGNTLHIGLMVWPEFPLLALSCLTDAMHYAASGENTMQCRLSLVSTKPDIPVISNTGISVIPAGLHHSAELFDYLAIIGGNLTCLGQGHADDRAYIMRAWQAGIPVMGIGTGSFILAEQGLLNGRRASVHPVHKQAFQNTFPGVRAEEGYDFIDEGDVLTCPGGMTTLLLTTALIRQHGGDDVAAMTRHHLAIAHHEYWPAAVSRPAKIALIADLRLRRAVMLIEQYLTRPLSTAWLADQVHLSARQLNRLFKAEFGKNLRGYIRHARLRYACWMLNNTKETVTGIAQRMGFSDCAHFIRHFQNEYGCTPGTWRTCVTAPETVTP